MSKLLRLILPALLILSLSVALVACGGDTGSDNSSTPASSSQQTTSSKGEDSTTSEEESQVEDKESLVVAPLPEGVEGSAAYTVKVRYGDGEEVEVPCYKAKVGKESISYEGEGEIATDEMAFCYFESDFSKSVYVNVTPSADFEKCVIRPVASGIQFTESDGSITFELKKAAKLSVEFDDEIYTNLFIYADNLQTEEFDEDDENVIYYGPGVHNAGQINLTTGKTLYLAPGAVVYGNVVAENAENIAIKGRGILCGSKLSHRMDADRTMLCTINNSKNVTIDGVIFLDSPTWTLRLYVCEDVTMNNIKQICWYYNSDGIDVCSGKNVTITNCFLRNYDDNISIKAFESKDNSNIKVSDCILWADCAHNMLVGPEAQAADYETQYTGISFKNITVLEQNEKSDFYKGVMAITCTDNAVFSGISWDNIKIERMSNGAVINFRFSDDYGTYTGKSISGVVVKNVTCNAVPARGDSILGLEDSFITDVSISNYVVNGKKITFEDHNFTGDFGYISALIIDGDERRVTSGIEQLGKPPYVKVEAGAQGNGTVKATLSPELFEAGKTYTITAIAKFDNIDNSVGQAGVGLGFVNYYIFDTADNLMSFSDFANSTSGSVGWRKYTATFTVPEGHGKITVAIGLWEAGGIVSCSEVELLDSDGNIVFFEDFSYGIDEVWVEEGDPKSVEVITEE